jgi:UrcA family protein
MLKATSIALAATLVCACPAFADEPEVQTRRVSVADLNLASAEGRTQLERRIKRAARAVCHDGASISGIALSAEAWCVRDSIDRTRPQVARLIEKAGSEVAFAPSQQGR